MSKLFNSVKSRVEGRLSRTAQNQSESRFALYSHSDFLITVTKALVTESGVEGRKVEPYS